MKTLTVFVTDEVYEELAISAREIDVPVDVWIALRLPHLAKMDNKNTVTLEEAMTALTKWIKTKPVGHRFTVPEALKEAGVRTDGRWIGRHLSKNPLALGRPLKSEFHAPNRFYTIVE